MAKKCITCGRWFKARAKTYLTCGPKCAWEANRKACSRRKREGAYYQTEEYKARNRAYCKAWRLARKAQIVAQINA